MASALAGMTSQDEQTRCLAEAASIVKKNAYFLKKGMDSDNLKEALKHAAAILGELRTGELQPHRYFELYMQVFDHLALLQSWFTEQIDKGRSLGDLYERVQWAGNVLPRLYLLCTVGACYIRSKEAPARDILRDLVEMCKGVQHPVRGLFLRAYLCQAVRGLLPDAGSGYDGAEGGDTGDAMEFLLVNFTEMNKLWVRMQHQGSAKAQERAAREKERQQLADLVGKNLTYLSQLDGLDFERYSTVALPRILEQVVGCRDDIAQQYLMQALIQGFPDEFHLGTLEALLGAVPQLQPGVRLAGIMASLMDRLARFVANGDDSVRQQLDEVDAFGRLKSAASKIAEAHADLPVAEIAAIHIGLARFASAVYPDNLQHIDSVLGACDQALADRDMSDARGERRVVELLSVPLEAYDVVTVLSLDAYPPLMTRLTPDRRREMALTIVRSILRNETQVSSVEHVERLFDFIAPLVSDADGDASDELDDEDVADEQGQVARLIHRLASPDVATQFAILQTARKRFAGGGPRRAGHVLPPLAAVALKLVRRLCRSADASDSSKPDTKAVLQFTHGVLVDLADVPGRENAAMGLLLAAATAASQEARDEIMAYEFFEQAFTLYEEAVPDSKAEVSALHAIVGALHTCRIFPPDARGALAHKATGFSAKLLKKGDQCRAVLACAHLFWQPLGGEDAQPSGAPSQEAETSAGEGVAAQEGTGGTSEAAPPETDAGAAPGQLQPPVRDAEAVMVCLKRSLKLANAAAQQLAVAPRATGLSAPVWLFVDILNAYVAHFLAGNPNITADVLQNLLELVANEVTSDVCQKDTALQRYHAASISHLKRRQEAAAGRSSDLGPGIVDQLQALQL